MVDVECYNVNIKGTLVGRLELNTSKKCLLRIRNIFESNPLLHFVKIIHKNERNVRIFAQDVNTTALLKSCFIRFSQTETFLLSVDINCNILQMEALREYNATQNNCQEALDNSLF